MNTTDLYRYRWVIFCAVLSAFLLFGCMDVQTGREGRVVTNQLDQSSVDTLSYKGHLYLRIRLEWVHAGHCEGRHTCTCDSTP